MKRLPRSPQRRPHNGFTLLEMLIALALTAVIGVVLFSTYNIAATNSVWVRKTVSGREAERIIPGIFESDLAGFFHIPLQNQRTGLPPLSREPIRPSTASATYADWDIPESEDQILLSFPTSTSLVQEAPLGVSGPVCVEYVLRKAYARTSLVRRERAFCGVDGLFPWTEFVLARSVEDVAIALYEKDKGYVEDWHSPVPADALPLAIRFSVRRPGEDTPTLVLVTPLAEQRIEVPS